jgi:hypothetical protein
MILDGFFAFTGQGAGGVPAVAGDFINDSPTTGTQISSKIIDLHMSGIPLLASGQGARDMGIGDKPSLKIMIEVDVAFASGTSLQVNLQAAPDNGSGAPGAFVTWYGSPVVTEANLIVGTRLLDLDLPRPPPGIGVPRFLQLQYITVGTHTVGKIAGFIVLDRIDQMYNSTVNSVLGGYVPGVTIPN